MVLLGSDGPVMKLTRLEVFGFKTFAKKLDIRLSAGITAVVGPNGCGKTNAVDAIRWALGEQRPTQIRLERMEDSIFKGSATRRQLGMAEVSLTIENESRRLPVEMPEVTITRRLFRSGESEYLLNRKICRLADINDLFMDTGMGTDSYSVFELAMINSILSDKTEDRRHIFEEAAGVTKYKARRKIALTRMLSIEDDLNRVGDIIAELERRVESLRRQAQKAARYRSLRSEFKARTVGIAAHEIGQLRKRSSAAEEELSSVRTLAAEYRERTTALGGEFDTLSLDMIDSERALGETTARCESVRALMSEREKEHARLDSRIEYLEQTAAKAREATQRNSAALEGIAETHGRCAESLDELSARLDEVARSIEEMHSEVMRCEERAVEKDLTLRCLETEFHRLEREIAACRAMTATIRVRRESGDARLAEIARRSMEIEAAAAETADTCAILREDRLRNASREQDLNRELLEFGNVLAAVNRKTESLDTDLRKARAEEASLRAERDFLAEVLNTFAGYSDGVRHAAGMEELRGRILCVLGDIVSAEDGYLRAVEAALADSLQSIVVDGLDAAIAGARRFARETLGRAVFLPSGEGSSGDRIFVVRDEGVLGPVCEFIRTDERFRPTVRRLLRDTYLVDSLETACRLHARFGEGRFVALDGSMVGAHGEIHSGAFGDRGAGATIGRREKLNRVEGALESSGTLISVLEERRGACTAEADRLRASIRDRERTRDELRRETASITSEEAHASAKRDSAVETLASLRTEAERIEESFGSFADEVGALEEKIARFTEHHSRLEASLRTTAGEVANIRAELDARRSRLNACEVERASLNEKRAALAREIEAARERREALAQSAQTLLLEVSEAESEMLEAGERKQALLHELESLGAEQGRLVAEKDELNQRSTDLRNRRSEQERALQNLRREQAEFARRESALTLERDEASLRIHSIVERLSDEFFITQENIPEPPDDPDFDPESERLLIEDLKRKIQTLDDVNMAAEADHREEKERLDFLVRERDDLMEARKSLDETIHKINHIARERFRETFERIRANFGVTFTNFFEGGACDLTIEEGEDPLEANILITARPPGKNVRSINLLSSGERALTAISLLFAIYLVKPSPFCILDEVDAPLDDANIDRFLRVIREFAKSTQFIMVTHNKKTMAAADTLYGITMEEPGLSTLVSVRLSRVGATEVSGEPELAEESIVPAHG